MSPRKPASNPEPTPSEPAPKAPRRAKATPVAPETAAVVAPPVAQPVAPPPPPAPPIAPPPPPAPAYAAPAQYGPPVYAAAPPPSGYAAPPPVLAPRDPATEKNWLNIAALVASATTPLTGVGWLVGIVFGHLGVAAAKRGEANNRGLGVAGLIIGYVLGALGALVIFVVFLGPLIAVMWAGFESSGADQPDWCTSPTYEYEYNGG